ncbi:MAG: LON peptidase substrate-binding domain-containing protein [Geodermatophilaceae bacterium]
MPETIALFPLTSTVLFPGVLLPLHIFEARYRTLVQDLLARPDGPQRAFGVVAIRQGWEVGIDQVQALHTVGCAAMVRRIKPQADGRYDVIGVGTDRFELLGVDDSSKPYLTGTVRWLDDEAAAPGEGRLLAARVGALFQGYARDVNRLQGADIEQIELPEDPDVLSYLVASAALLDLEDRQSLLAESSTVQRLRLQAALLRRESTMLRRLRAVPVPLIELTVPRSAN